jgi:hypothetical protein
MQRAKRNVEEHYAVVGILEEMDLTLQVLENYVPRFFSGATKVYYGPSDATNIHFMNPNACMLMTGTSLSSRQPDRDAEDQQEHVQAPRLRSRQEHSAEELHAGD